MSRHDRTIHPASPILTDTDCYAFHGPKIDAFIAFSKGSAIIIAAELNSDNQEFSVVRFNAVEGTCRDVTSDFLAENDDDFEDSNAASLARHNRSFSRPSGY